MTTLTRQKVPTPSGRRATETRVATRSTGRQVLLLLGAAIGVLTIMGLLGLVLTHVVDHSGLVRADRRISDGLFHHRTAGWNSVTWWATQAGEALTVIVGGAVVALVIRWRSGRWMGPVFLLVSLGGEASIYVLTTLLVHRHRPLVKHLDAAPPTSSFPSGHTAAAVCLYGGLAVLAWRLSDRRPLQIVATIVAVLLPIAVAVARVYRGMHFPTDVVSGAILGMLWLTAVTIIVNPRRPHEANA